MPNGAKIEAGIREAEANATFEPVDFLQSFNATPVVLISITSDNDSQGVVARKHAISADGFSLMLQKQGADASAGLEAVDYTSHKSGFPKDFVPECLWESTAGDCRFSNPHDGGDSQLKVGGKDFRL